MVIEARVVHNLLALEYVLDWARVHVVHSPLALKYVLKWAEVHVVYNPVASEIYSNGQRFMSCIPLRTEVRIRMGKGCSLQPRHPGQKFIST